MNDIKHILAVCRSTKHCDKAVHYGISLAKQNGAKLYVLHVFDHPFGLEAWSLPVVSLKEIQEEYRRMQNKTRIDIDRIRRFCNLYTVSINLIPCNTDIVCGGIPYQYHFCWTGRNSDYILAGLCVTG